MCQNAKPFCIFVLQCEDFMLFSSNVKRFPSFVIMVAAFSTPSSANNNKQQTPTRRPPLEKDNTNGVVSRRPRARQVSSRYLSPAPSTSTSVSTSTTTTTNTTASSSSSSSSRRCGSPFIARSGGLRESLGSGSPGVKRAQSVDRRRPVPSSRVGTPVLESKGNNVGDVSNASRLLIASSRSLSVSFQGEAFSLPISKAKTTTPTSGVSNLRKGTPERRKVTPVKGRGDQVENCKSLDQRRWPAKTREGGLVGRGSTGPVSLMRSVDCGDGLRRSGGVVGSGMGSRSLQLLVGNEGRRASFDGRLSLDLGSAEMLRAVNRNLDRSLGNESPTMSCDLAASDSDSVSSGSTSGVQDCTAGAKQKSVPKPIVVSSRFWQETNSRLRRLQDPGSTLSNSPSSKAAVAAKVKRFSSDNMSTSPRTMASPSRGSARPASPSKLWASTTNSPSRRSPSPSRVRSYIAGSLNGNSMEQPSILSFSLDIRRGKLGEDRIINAHMLRLLHNRYMQWRFVNARAEATFTVQKLNAERNLWNAWVTTSELQHSVTLKRMKLLLLRQKVKLASILKGQMAFLEEWDLLEKDHCNSLIGATEALKACTLRLPLFGKAIADVQILKEAIASAVDVMQAMASSICSLSPKAKEMNAVVAELVNITAKERLFLDQCKSFLSIVSAMQVRDRSLRTHLIQLKQVPTSTSLTAFD